MTTIDTVDELRITTHAISGIAGGTLHTLSGQLGEDDLGEVVDWIHDTLSGRPVPFRSFTGAIAMTCEAPSEARRDITVTGSDGRGFIIHTSITGLKTALNGLTWRGLTIIADQVTA
ncbi:MAG: hypothetical protein Q4B10_03590 [Actinomycetaceae bacterium]|nr:hypothetical protein [Actinomycetaceae bacterium]